MPHKNQAADLGGIHDTGAVDLHEMGADKIYPELGLLPDWNRVGGNVHLNRINAGD